MSSPTNTPSTREENSGAFYNEIEPFAAAWLRNLESAGQIAHGVVDDRDVRTIQPAELAGYSQCHFFAGIGGWSHALRLAGWPDDAPVWTGSCPCQPFSQAGKRAGADDERHLWPTWFGLIRECRPAVIFGEQVASPDGLEWFDSVSADLEAEGYAVGAADLCSAGVGAPHARQRLYFVADAGGERRDGLGVRLRGRGPQQGGSEAARGGETRGLADTEEARRGARRLARAPGRQAVEPAGRCHAGRVGDADGERPQVDAAPGPGEGGVPRRPGASDFWSDAEWIQCLDGKLRPAQPGSFPLAPRVPGDVGRLRGYGNAITPQVAAVFIEAVMGVLYAA